jgi:hypothetical protein
MPPEASLDLANILRNLHVVSSRSYPQETADLDKVQRHASVNTTYLPCKHYLIFGDVTDAGTVKTLFPAIIERFKGTTVNVQCLRMNYSLYAQVCIHPTTSII